MRLDDASEYWNTEKWKRMHSLLNNYNIRPLVAIIPDFQDFAEKKPSSDEEYLPTINKWVHEDGWEPCLHGCTHQIFPAKCLLNPIHTYSEFCGLSLETQCEKIRRGLEQFRLKIKADPRVFIAPCHTYDQNTIKALRKESNIRIISDTVANDVYYHDEFYYIPLQSGMVRRLPFSLVTFCYHPNTMNDQQFLSLEEFLERHHRKFVSFDNVKLQKREKSLFDKVLQKLYLLRSRC